MKFTATKQNLLTALSFVATLAGKASTLPILGHVKIEAQKDKLILTATNLDIWTTAQCEADVKNPGVVCLPARLLVEYMRKGPDSEVEFSVESGKQKTTAKSGRSISQLSHLAGDEFPAHAPINGTKIELATKDLLRAINAVKAAQSTDPSRFILNGILFEADADRLTLVTTDGRRLALSSFITPGSGKGLYVVPSGIIEQLASALKVGGEAVSCVFADNSANFTCGDWSIAGKLVEGNYPNYKQVIPANNNHKATVGRDAFIDIIRRAQTFTNEKASSIKLEFSAKSLSVSAGTGEHSITDTIDATGPDLAIAVSPEYLLDAITPIEGENVDIYLADALSPILIKELDYLAVVMPMRMS